jgi:hypothetical protein
LEEAYSIFSKKKAEQVDYANQLIPINDGVQAMEVPELNRRHLNRILLNTIAKGKADFDIFQKAKLLDIAAQCPEEGGEAVYQARGILAKSFIFDQTSCDDYMSALVERSAENNGRSISAIGIEANLRPNPNNGQFSLDIYGEFNEPLEFVVWNVMGNVMFKSALQTSDGFRFDLSYLPKGIYCYKVIDQTGMVKSGRFVIQ